MASILVTGGNGFIASYVVDALARDPRHSVIVLDPRRRPYDALPEGVQWVQGTLSDAALVERTLGAHHCDVVCHVAWLAAADSTQEEELNLAPTRALVAACERANVRRMVYVSSAAVYGAPDAATGEHVDESAPTRPISAYGHAKLEGERIIERSALERVVLRVSAPFGPRQDPTRARGAVNIFIHRALNGLPITVRGDGQALRDYFFIADAMPVLASAATSEAARDIVLNLGGPCGYTLNQLLDEIARALGVRLEVRREPLGRSEIPRLTLDSAAAGRLFGWSARTSLQDGIAKTAVWMRGAGLAPASPELA